MNTWRDILSIVLGAVFFVGMMLVILAVFHVLDTVI